jgi:DNA-binding NtrC family response regulator
MQNDKIELLVVDDDHEFRSLMVARFSRSGFHVTEATCADEAMDAAQRREFDVAVFDMVMPGGPSGIDLLEKFKAAHPECETLLLTGQGTIELAVRAMKLGAYDFLTKPFPLKNLEDSIHKAYEHHLLRRENEQLKTLLKRRETRNVIIGQSAVMREVFRLIERAGPSDKAILIQGESGTGKELVARALHDCSNRSSKPLVVINCAALPEALLESELFGHVRPSALPQPLQPAGRRQLDRQAGQRAKEPRHERPGA